MHAPLWISSCATELLPSLTASIREVSRLGPTASTNAPLPRRSSTISRSQTWMAVCNTGVPSSSKVLGFAPLVRCFRTSPRSFCLMAFRSLELTFDHISVAFHSALAPRSMIIILPVQPKPERRFHLTEDLFSSSVTSTTEVAAKGWAPGARVRFFRSRGRVKYGICVNFA